MTSGDTIAAISSAAGPAARMILRLSGPDAGTIAEKIQSHPHPGAGGVARSDLIVRGMAVPSWLYCFKAPRSYTGEDLVEFHIPGNPLLAKMLLEELLRAGARAAEAGEFTARAYFHGRLDLTAAEGVAATIAAGNEQELAAARRLMSGELVRRLAPAIEMVADTLALLEVGIDFSDEDLTFISATDAGRQIAGADAMLRQLLDESVRFERLADEPGIVLVGRPNAGKSTLLNALAGRDRAVVSPVAGTTRDVLSAEVSLAHGVVRLSDVAGIEEQETESGSPLQMPVSASSAAAQVTDEEQAAPRISPSADTSGEGGTGGPPVLSERKHGRAAHATEHTDHVSHRSGEARRIDMKMREHALRAVEEADLVVLVHDATDPRPPLALPREPDLLVRSKTDLLDLLVSGAGIAVSALTGHGLAALRQALDQLCFAQSSATSFLALNARHVQAIEEARAGLARAAELTEAGPEFIATELREALDALGRVSGQISPDDLLGRIFGAFCIGK